MALAGETEIQRILRLCRALDLPEVTESTSQGSPSVNVADTEFASVRARNEMILHCPLEQKELLMLMAPEIYWQTEQFKSWPGLIVRMNIIGDEELSLRLEDAWQFRAPKPLAEAYAARSQKT